MLINDWLSSMPDEPNTKMPSAIPVTLIMFLRISYWMMLKTYIVETLLQNGNLLCLNFPNGVLNVHNKPDL